MTIQKKTLKYGDSYWYIESMGKYYDTAFRSRKLARSAAARIKGGYYAKPRWLDDYNNCIVHTGRWLDAQ